MLHKKLMILQIENQVIKQENQVIEQEFVQAALTESMAESLNTSTQVGSAMYVVT